MEKIRVGVIGAGWRSEIVGLAEKNPHVEIVGVADVDASHMDAFAQGVGHEVYQFTDYRKLLEKKDIDAVFVMTPDYLHEEHALAALAADKYVYLEKPMAITIEGCDRLLKAGEAKGNKMMVGFNMRYMAMFQTMKDIINRGDIGEIKAVWVRHFVGRGGDYYFHDWHAVRAYTTSLLLQKASHDIDMIHWLTGHYAQRVAGFGGLDYFGGSNPNDLRCGADPVSHAANFPECCAWEYNPAPRNLCAFRQEIDVEDNQVVIMQLEGGIKVSYTQCHFTPDYHRNFTLIGTEGRIENSEPDSAIWIKHRHNIPRKGLYDETVSIRQEEGHASADERILGDFVDMIFNGEQPPVGLLDGRMSVAVGVKAAESIRSGGQVMEIPAVAL